MRCGSRQDFPAAIPVVKTYLRSEYNLSPEEADDFFPGLSKDGQPAASIFGCLHCRKHLVSVVEP
jgi:hypothetical protein